MRLFIFVGVLFTSIAAAGAAGAAEIKVLTAGAYKAVLVALVPEFEKSTGHKVVLENDTAGALQKRISGGDAFDLAVITPGVVGILAKDGKIAGTPVNL